MYAKKLTYKNFNDEEITETKYFNLTKAELAQMEIFKEGGFQAYAQKIVDAKSKPELVALFKELLLAAYGEKSADGNVFRKNDKLKEDFECSAFFNEYFMILANDDKEAAAFVNGIMPKDLAEKVAQNNNA